MARSSRDLVVYDSNNRKLVRIMKDGVVMPGFESVYLELVAANVQQAGDPWGAQAANLVTRINTEDPNNPYYELFVDAGQEGAKKGLIQWYRANSRPAALAPGEGCVLPNGTAYIGNFAGLPSLLTPEPGPLPPTAANDSTKGYKLGDIKISGTYSFRNLVTDRFANPGNWTVESGSLTAGSYGAYQLALRGARPEVGVGSAGLATLGGSIQTLPAGHKIFVWARVTSISSSSRSWAVKDAYGNTMVSVDISSTGQIFTPSSTITGATMALTVRHGSLSSCDMDISKMVVVDMTADLGAGNEMTAAEAYNFFSQFPQWQPVYTPADRGIYICTNDAPGAAAWRKL
ncbi:hypothetical protein LJC60_06285 [Ruminococcaceae bacterium OttesenSCG-928-D13]|nr:hypothetical protein [Ruminococcaceae bacterium OttesenSCG-928-D13]